MLHRFLLWTKSFACGLGASTLLLLGVATFNLPGDTDWIIRLSTLSGFGVYLWMEIRHEEALGDE